MYLATYTGLQFDLMAPDPAAVHLLDIARPLSRICRFGGHTRKFYSVAQHSLLVDDILANNPTTPRHVRLYGLMHDAHEAYVGDIPTPVAQALDKMAPGCLHRLKGRVQDCINLRWGLAPTPAELATVGLADQRALLVEKEDLKIEPGVKWANLHGLVRPALGYWLTPMDPEEAMMAFVERFMALFCGDA